MTRSKKTTTTKTSDTARQLAKRNLAEWREETRDELSDLRKLAEEVRDALDNADSCETDSDFDANIEDAHVFAADLVKQLAAILAKRTQAQAAKQTMNDLRSTFISAAQQNPAPRTERCSDCNQQKPAGQMNGYGECTACAEAKVARQRAASGLASDYGPAADAAIDQAIAKLPALFGLRNHAGSTFRVSRASSFVSGGVIWLYMEALRDGQWLSALRATPAEIAAVIVADPNAEGQV